MKVLYEHKIVFVLLLIAGLWLLYRIRRRKFNRRNIAGQEVFPSIRHAMMDPALEGCGLIVALILILAGLLLWLLSMKSR